MNYWYQKPHPQLIGYVRTVLILEGFATPAADLLPLFTNGSPALLCRTEKDDAGNESVRQATLFGKSMPAECWSFNDHTTIVAYFFKPFALATLFDISAVSLAKNPVDLCNWDAHKTNALKTQLAYAQSTKQKVDILDHLLITQLNQNSKECESIRFATDEMMSNPGTEILSEVLGKLEMNERTFQRMFKKYIGVTPSQYRRICQFQLSFAQLRAKNFNKLTDVAYDNGFADQSHFTRSFKEFADITPNDYLRSGLKKQK